MTVLTNVAAQARRARRARYENLAPSRRCLKQPGSVLCGARSYCDLAAQPAAHELRHRVGLPDILSADGVESEHAAPVPQQPKLNSIDTRPTDAQPTARSVVIVFVTGSNGPVLLGLRVATLRWCVAIKTWWQLGHITEQLFNEPLAQRTVRVLNPCNFVGK
jgi:hypothetical protein